ncbi:hypothetical protein T12_1106 [Trichinella patagoniensis]|uniref:Uncharacterized protein n=1 Tax=Trichinella patagoniensis TaxID=990121 RepID=A0A0V1ABY3_9BILA|nr:hypothetical protein T12_1106 [Trichinella patagoniensis]
MACICLYIGLPAGQKAFPPPQEYHFQQTSPRPVGRLTIESIRRLFGIITATTTKKERLCSPLDLYLIRSTSLHCGLVMTLVTPGNMDGRSCRPQRSAACANRRQLSPASRSIAIGAIGAVGGAPTPTPRPNPARPVPAQCHLCILHIEAAAGGCVRVRFRLRIRLSGMSNGALEKAFLLRKSITS